MADLAALAFVLSLAAWRLTSLLHSEGGPFEVFVRFRALLGVVHGEDGEPVGYPENFIGGLFECFWCLSMWVALPLAVACGWAAGLAAWTWPVLWLASAAGAIWMEKWTGRSKARW